MEYCAEPFEDLCLCAMEDLEEIEESEYKKKAEEIQSKNKRHISNFKMAYRICKYFKRFSEKGKGVRKMRLIDADNFKQLVTAVSLANGESVAFVNEFCKLIDSQPTSYDVDKVVEQLKSQESELTTWAEDEAYKLGIEKAIEIVKYSGIE